MDIKMSMKKKRCKWCNENNPLYVRYHDEEWGKLNFDEGYLYEMLLLESFQAGLSWECVLNKREAFRKAYDGFDLNAVCAYTEKKVAALLENKGIIRNRRKIEASIENSRIFKKLREEFGSFSAYLLRFTEGKILYEYENTTNALSDKISKDLIKRGMRFVGSTIIYSYLQAIGVIVSHEKDCFLHNNENNDLHFEPIIRKVEKNKKQYLSLLLLADEQEDMIDRYLDRGDMLVMEIGGEVICECVITDEGDGILEIKSLATEPRYQKMGYARRMIDHLCSTYRESYDVLQVGTGESPMTLPFYEKCGFSYSHRIKDFFTENYDHPIIEGGVLLRDMVFLRKKFN